MASRPWVLLAVVLVSCRDAGPKGTFAVRDSSGVQIVSNPSAVTGDSGCPRVDTVPALTIGGAGAEGPYDLLRPSGALRLPDGGVVVVNGGTSELRVFDSTGRYARTFGRKGSGPGEYQNPAGLLWYGADTLLVADYGTSRLTLLGADGRLLEAIRLQGVYGCGLLGRLPDGSIVCSVGKGYSPGVATGKRRDPMYLVRVSREGAALDTIGTFPAAETVVEGNAQSISVSMVPFGKGTFAAMRDGRAYVADNAEYRVRVYAGGRRLERIVERAHEPVAVTAAAVAREKAQRTRSTTNPQFLAEIEKMFQRDRLPGTEPAHGRIAVDADGWLWVRAYGNSTVGDVAWDVFDATGRLRCALVLPAALAVREIGHDFVLGVATDADGVEQVRMLRLRRSASSQP